MQASKVAPRQDPTDQNPTRSSLSAIGSMSSRRIRVARMDWCASRRMTSVIPNGWFFRSVIMIWPLFCNFFWMSFSATAACAVLADSRSYYGEHFGVDRLRNGGSRTFRCSNGGCGVRKETADDERHQVDQTNQQHQKDKYRSQPHEHQINAFHHQFGRGHYFSISIKKAHHLRGRAS